MNNYTTQWFRDKLFESALEKHKADWHRFGRRDTQRIDYWLKDERKNLADQEWIHDLGDEYEETLYTAFGNTWDKEFCDFIQIEIDRYIENGELERYIDEQMTDYVNDISDQKRESKCVWPR